MMTYGPPLYFLVSMNFSISNSPTSPPSDSKPSVSKVVTSYHFNGSFLQTSFSRIVKDVPGPEETLS